MMPATVINYIAWYIFVFISVMWVLVLIRNRKTFSEGKLTGNFPIVSIMIPAYNEEKSIGETLRSLVSLDYPKRLIDIIVVNDASTDSTRKIAESFRSLGVRVLNNSRNRGKAYSLNKAIRAAKGEIIASIDADSIVESQIIKKMVGYFDDPDVGSVTPALKVWKRETLLEKVQYAEYMLNIFLRRALSFIDSIHVTPGAFSMYRKDVLIEVGGFEEGNLTEDMDIALKIHNLGYKIENNLNALSYTLCPSTWRDLFKQRIRWYRGAIQNSIKYKYMFFNPKYGNIGFFFLPVNLMSVAVILGIFGTLFWNYANIMIDITRKMSIINWDLSIFNTNFNMSFIMNSISTPVVLAAIGIVLAAVVLYNSFRMSNESMSGNRMGYMLYLLFFPLVMMAFWSLAIILELFRIKRKW